MSTSFDVAPQGVQVVQPTLIWQDAAGNNQTFDTFTVMVESHGLHSQVSEHPVEEGVDVADNTRPEVDHITLEVFVSQTPANAGTRQTVTGDLPPHPIPFTINGALTALGLLAGPATVSPSLDVLDPKDYVNDALTQFKYLRDTATLIQIILAHAQYSNMVLQNVDLHRDRGVGLGGSFTLEFREIRVVSTSVTAAPQAAPNAAPEKSAGNVSTSVPKKSVAASLKDFFGG